MNASFVLAVAAFECGQAGRVQSKALRAGLQRADVEKLGADIKAPDRRPDEIGADASQFEVRDPYRAAKARKRIIRIIDFRVGAEKRRSQSRQPVMLVGGCDVPTRLLFADAAGGENAIGRNIRIPTLADVLRRKARAKKAIAIDGAK